MEYYNYIKSLHLIFVITWFAGLFYEPRLFIYHIEASKKDSPEKDILEKQLKIMSRRLWYFIAWPSAILASIFGVWLLILFPSWIEESWMRVKVIFVFLLFAYHFKTHQIFLQLQKDEINYSSHFMRIWNEGATLFLFVIVFLAILKNAINWIFIFLGALFLGMILIIVIKLYRVLRRNRILLMINLFKHISLRTQIFLSMIILVLMACLLILFATYYQYQNESLDYNIFRLNRKESQLRKQINYLVEKNNLLNKKYDLWDNYNDEFNAVIKIHNVNYSVFDVNGKALFTSFLPSENYCK